MLPGDFSGDECLSSPRAFVVEEDPVAGEHAVSLAIVDHHPVGVKLGHAIRRSVFQIKIRKILHQKLFRLKIKTKHYLYFFEC